AWPHIARRKPVQNSFTESLSGCVIPVLPFRPATARGSSEQRRRNATPAGVDHVSRGSFSAVGLGAPSSARVRPFPAAAAACRRFGLFGAVALGTLKAIIRFAYQQTPGDLQRVKTRPSLAILCGGRARLF